MTVLLIAAGCAPEDRGPPEGVVLHERVTCEDPEAREETPFDHLQIASPPADEDRFWGAGAVAADLDGDGDVDVFLPGPQGVRLYRNHGDGRLVADPGAVPAEPFERVVGAAAADVDADGDLDLAVTRFGFPALLLRNDDGVFVDAGDRVVSGPAHHGQSPTFGDLNGDGRLDLVLAGHGKVEVEDGQAVIRRPGDPTRILLGGDGGFVDRSDLVPELAHGAYTFVATMATLDDDLRPDLLLANDYPAWRSCLALPRGDEAFELAPELGLDVNGTGMGVAAEDTNLDGLDDFLLTLWNDVILLRSDTEFHVWIDATGASDAALAPHDGRWVPWGAEFVDLDLDGDLDAVVASGHLTPEAPLSVRGLDTTNEADQTYTVLLADGDGFVDGTQAMDLGQIGTWRGFAVGDLNGDGWPDLVRRDLRGDAWVDLSRCGDETWLTVRPTPPAAAVGARIEVVAGRRTFVRTIRAGGTSLASGGAPEAMFGLADLRAVDDVRILWPDGTEQHTGRIRTRRVIEVRHP